MGEFEDRLETIDQAALKTYLIKLKALCYESALLRIVFPEMDIFSADTLTLYQNHFLLFHILYILQDEFYAEDKFLYVHFMRTRLLPYPEVGDCRFFEEQQADFCRATCDSQSLYCRFHNKRTDYKAIEILSAKYFYLYTNNYYRLDQETAEAFIRGTWKIFAKYDRYKQSFKLLGIPETGDLSIIKKAFRRLAKTYHPDYSPTSREKFIEINNAYQFLMHVLPMLQGNHH